MPVVVLVGAVGLKVGPVIKFIGSDRLLLLRDICCYGQNPLWHYTAARHNTPEPGSRAQ